MRILITGGAGFVDSNLTLHLCRTCRNAAVVCMDNLYRRGSELNVPRPQKASVRFHRGDLADANSFPAGSFDFIVGCIIEDISNRVSPQRNELEHLLPART